MRHRKNFNHLGRKAGHRKAMLANMASSLILHKRIKTTTAKAKALRMYVEPLISKTKGLDSLVEKTHAQRVVFSYLKDKHAVNELFVEVAPKVEQRPGGYTRIVKLGNRLGDNADMCIIELVDFNETMLSLKADSQQATGKRRRRRGGGSGEAKQAKPEQLVVKEKAPEKAVEDTGDKQEMVVEDTTDAANGAEKEVKEEQAQTDNTSEESIPATKKEVSAEEKNDTGQIPDNHDEEAVKEPEEEKEQKVEEQAEEVKEEEIKAEPVQEEKSETNEELKAESKESTESTNEEKKEDGQENIEDSGKKEE